MSISINPDPRMTAFLVESEVFRNDPVTVVDVGARWGFQPEWRVFGNSLRVYCFEPDAEECAKLNAGADSNVFYIPAALGRENGPATLYEARLNASSGLYKTDMNFFSRLLNRDNGEVAKEHRIEVTTLDDALKSFDVDSIDFIKLDVEGAEVDVLRGAKNYVTSSKLIGILSEFRFHEEINGSPVFAELDAFVRNFGFRLFDMHYSHQSRRALPYPGLADYRLPSGEKFYAYTTHGQIMDGDALYFRDLLISTNEKIRDQATPIQILKAAALFEIYSLNDCAGELILANNDQLRRLVNCDDLLDLLTPSLSGSNVGYKAYIASYFDSQSSVVQQNLAADAVNVRASGLKNILRKWLPVRLKSFLRGLFRV